MWEISEAHQIVHFTLEKGEEKEELVVDDIQARLAEGWEPYCVIETRSPHSFVKTYYLRRQQV